MSRNTQNDHPIHELLEQRWSPYAFDSDKVVDAADIRSLFEAARWAMSSYNAQPWRYIIAARATDPETWERIHGCLVEGNQPWTLNAPVLALGLVERNFEHNGKPNKAAEHDLGAASAFLTVEATSRGLYVHQMIGINPDKVRETFAIESSVEPFTGLAIGYLGSPDNIPDAYAERDQNPRVRKPLSEIILHGTV